MKGNTNKGNVVGEANGGMSASEQTRLTAVEARVGSIVNHGTSDTSGYTLTKNNVHVWGEVASLDVSSLEDADGEYMIEFRSGATATTLTYGQSLKWNETASVDANKTYKMWIVRGCATLMGFE